MELVTGNGRNLRDCGVRQILVKFREADDLQPLTASRQSGGERSVATILYLIAIQVARAMIPVNLAICSICTRLLVYQDQRPDDNALHRMQDVQQRW